MNIPRVNTRAPPESAGTPLKNEPIEHPIPTVAPTAINAPPRKPFNISPFGGIRSANSLEKRAPAKDPSTIKITSIP